MSQPRSYLAFFISLHMKTCLKDVRDEDAQREAAGCGELRMGICLKNLQGEEAHGEFTKPDLDGVLASWRRIRVAAESCL